MKPFLDLALQQAAKPIQSCHYLLQPSISSFGRVSRSMVASAQAVVLIVFLVFSSLLLIPATPAYAQVLTPRQVVEYALTLEKLEDDLYERAIDAFSSGLSSLPQEAKDAVQSYGEDEADHAIVLAAVLTQLGGDPSKVTIPDEPNYNAILGRNLFGNPRDFLLGLQYVEDLGVAAYKGQVGNLLNAVLSGSAPAKTVLAGALEIHTIEARHAAGIRYLRQRLYNANIRPWIRSPKEVLYNENTRPNVPVPFDDVAFDGFATANEVLELVGPVLKQ